MALLYLDLGPIRVNAFDISITRLVGTFGRLPGFDSGPLRVHPMTDAARRQYDRAALNYDHRWSWYVQRTLDLVEAKAAIRPNDRVLDVACGTGAFVERLVSANPEQFVVGVDVSNGMLAQARDKLGDHPKVHFVEASAEALPFDTGSFAVVVSASSFHYFQDPEAALTEMSRVLRPGGRLVLLDWDRGRWWMRLLDATLRVFDRAHERAFTSEEMLRMVGESGFTRMSVESVRLGVWGMAVVEGVKR